jgi:hypothetical protein
MTCYTIEFRIWGLLGAVYRGGDDGAASVGGWG